MTVYPESLFPDVVKRDNIDQSEYIVSFAIHNARSNPLQSIGLQYLSRPLLSHVWHESCSTPSLNWWIIPPGEKAYLSNTIQVVNVSSVDRSNDKTKEEI